MNRQCFWPKENFTKFMSIFTPGKLKKLILKKNQFDTKNYDMDDDSEYKIIRDYLAIPEVGKNLQELSFDESRSNSQHLETVLKIPGASKLQLTSFHTGYLRNFNPNWMNQLQFENLKTLHICLVDNYFQFDEYQMSKLVNLESLTLIYLAYKDTYGPILDPQWAPKLRNLNLFAFTGTTASLQTILNPFVNLTSLNLSYNKGGLTDKTLAAICTKLTNLRHLNMNACPQIKGTGFVKDTLIHLESLMIEGCKLKSSVIQNIFHFKVLKTIDLTNCRNLDDQGFIALGKQNPSLKKINLSDTKITNAGLIGMVQGLKTLRDLTLRGCDALTRASVFKIDDHCPHLKKLWKPIFEDERLPIYKSRRAEKDANPLMYDQHYPRFLHDEELDYDSDDDDSDDYEDDDSDDYEDGDYFDEVDQELLMEMLNNLGN